MAVDLPERQIVGFELQATMLPAIEESGGASALLVRDMHWYTSLPELVETIHDSAGRTSNTSGDDDATLSLPLDICQRIGDFFVIEPVNMIEVSVLSCSSHDRSCNPNDVLNEDENSWWISERGSMPRGVGRVVMEFGLNKTGNSLRRLREICIKAPPMPQGPLSLRTFQIRTTVSSKPRHDGDMNDDWQEILHGHVASHAGWQRFRVAPTDCLRLQLVCLTNQISLFLMDEGVLDRNHPYSAVGLYSIRFE